MGGIGEWARATPERAALISARGIVSFAELDDRQKKIAGAMAEDGLVRGDRIAVLARNRSEYLEVTGGALRAGIVPVPLHHLLTEPEIAYILEDSGARWLFTDRSGLEHPELDRTVTFGDAFERMLHEASPGEVSDISLGRPMHYTSGTTGSPKGVWVDPTGPARAEALSNDFRAYWWLNIDDIHLVCSPLSHSAPHRFALRTLEAGGGVALTSRFDAEEILAAIELFAVTTTFMVPTHLERILALGRRALARYDVSSIRLLVHAGAPIRPETKLNAMDMFPSGSVWEFYGSTEGAATRISPDEWQRKPGSVGTPPPGAEILVTDEAGRPLEPDEIGEVWIRDPRAERFEYWHDRAKTASAWRDDAFTAGDLGYLDPDGYLFLSGRKHDVIISGGVNVYPQEVEAVLMQHPSVEHAVVFGVADPDWGQQVRAMVVPAYGQPLEVALLSDWLKGRLAGFKLPKVIEVADELPTTPTGKIKRRPD
jgi:long-chain acyl-CoA synthetase